MLDPGEHQSAKEINIRLSSVRENILNQGHLSCLLAALAFSKD